MQSELINLANEISVHTDWWLFPKQEPIQGFWGAGPVFIVGDQPSTSEWGPEHPQRTVFDETLEAVGLENAHLTDLYKKRGLSGSLESGLPTDFPLHLNLFRQEMRLLQPRKIIALGELAQRLLIQNLPEWQQSIPRIWHFSHVVKVGKQSRYAENMREIIAGCSSLLTTAKP